MTAKPYRFEAHPDKGEVSALLLRPRGAKELVVLGHGAGAGMNHDNMNNIANAFASQKIATLRYQFPFMERGGGRDSQKVSIATICNAIRFARKKAPKLRLFAGGHSFGGRMTSWAAATEDLGKVEGLIFCSFPLHAAGRPSNDRAAHLPDSKLPMLFLSGNRDTMMTKELFQPILKKLGKQATFHELATANHGYNILKKTRTSEESVFAEMARVTREWMDRV